MNEEISTPETAVELDTDIVKATLVDSTLNNAEYDIKTAYVTRTVNVPQQVRIPLYISGQLKSTEEQSELRDDFVWEAHRQAVRSAFPKAAGAVNELAQRFKVIKATFWAAVDEVCSKVGKTRVDLPVSGGFNAEQMVAFAIENGMSAADIASYTSKFAIISLNLLQNNRNWDELFVDIPAPAATETETETTEATTTTTAENGEE